MPLYPTEFDYKIFGSYTPSGNRGKPEVVGLSGGRSSAAMLIALINGGFGSSPNHIVGFENTGAEDETCYQFLHDLQQYVSIPILWLEYTNTDVFQTLLRPDFSYDRFNACGYSSIFEIFDVVKLLRMGKYKRSKKHAWYKEEYAKSSKQFKQIDFHTASRNNKPFIDIFLYFCAIRLMKRMGLILPNVAQRWCTDGMKIKVKDRYLATIGIRNYLMYMGMRVDEPDRVDKLFRRNDGGRIEYDCPLHWNATDKLTVSQMWANQPIDLGRSGDANTFRDLFGNCVFCHMKARLKKLYLMQQGRDFGIYRQCETIVNNYNLTPSAMSKQHGTYEQLYTEAMGMREIKLAEVLSDVEKDINCFACGD